MTKLYATYYVNQGILAQRAKKNSAAEEAFKQAVSIQPDNVNALNSLGSLYYNQGATLLKTDADKAKEEFKQAKEYLDKLIPLLSGSKENERQCKYNVEFHQFSITVNIFKKIAKERQVLNYLPLSLFYHLYYLAFLNTTAVRAGI